ncbi:BTAD domain-containing putative transcriptional regulator [Sphaerisporangium sp. NPDC005288]|uniref:BTAD domain-containing putative transcriptional regulator n=1 Tax=Sphaerisporangium sp. NPDC005288 TaxID=3155114 RepID=UPI0033A26490
MRVGILGPLRVQDAHGNPVEVAGARLRALLVRLALDPGRVVTVERLVDDLWPGEPPANPAAALQSLVARLRRELGGREAVASHPSGYRLGAEGPAVDAWVFDARAARGAALLRAGDPSGAGGPLREALELWRGPALVDASRFPFAAAPAARLEELRLATLEARIDADLACAVPGLVAELEELAAAHPTREPFQARLMRALCADGRRADALEVYERVRAALADGLGVDPGAELRAAHLHALRADASPAVQGTAAGGNLPAPLTRLVGRHDDLARVGRLLGEARLVTVIGPGGAGKTRLAVEAARRERAPDGVWLVELAHVTRPSGVLGHLPRPSGVQGHLARPSGVAAAVHAALAGTGLLAGLGGARGAGPAERLCASLGGRRALLVLDNCEHVVEEAAELVQRVLAAAPGVRVLATGREPLGVTGEALHPLPPLAVPGEDVTPLSAPSFAAVALFAERAAAVRPGFAVDEGNLADVVRLCRELDGMPLAIELAAARLRSLTLAQLAGMIGDRLEVLGRGSRAVERRHRTLRATIDWSWELLTEPERAALRRLSVFAGGGASAEAAARVCGAGLDVLTSLVDRSLLVQAADGSRPGEGSSLAGDGEGVRYRLLETVRHYAAEKLAQSTESAGSAGSGSTESAGSAGSGSTESADSAASSLGGRSVAGAAGGSSTPGRDGTAGAAVAHGAAGAEERRVRAAHAAYFLELAERCEPSLRGPEQAAALRLLDGHQGDLDAALGHAIECGWAETAVRLYTARLWSWVMRGRRREAADWAAAVARATGDAPPPGLAAEHAMCLLLAGSEDTGGEGDGAGVAGMRPGELLDRMYRSDRPAVLGSWAIVGAYAGGVADIRRRAAAAVEHFGRHPDAWARATTLLIEGIVEFEFVPGGAPRAEVLVRSASRAFHGLGERWGMALALFWLSLVAENRGEPAEALALLEESAARAAEIGGVDALPGPAMLPVRLGQLRARTGDLAGAEAVLRQARVAAERAGDALAQARTWHALGETARRAGDHAEARTRLRRAMDLLAAEQLAGGTASRPPMIPPQLVAFVWLEAARVEALAGDRAAGERRLREALEAVAAIPDDTARATVLEGAAEWLVGAGEPGRAAAALAAASRLRGVPDSADREVAALVARCRDALGEARFAAAWRAGACSPVPDAAALLPGP